MISIYRKIEKQGDPLFTMPASLRWRKELGEAGIRYDDLPLTDIISIVYSLRIDNAERYIKMRQQEAMRKRGVSEVRAATEEDFDNL